MEIKHLRVLVAAIEAGSLQAASRQLNVAQPALSRRIMDLEAMLGCELLVRNARGVTPTKAGLALYRDALGIIDMVAEAGQRAQRLGLEQARAIRLGLVKTARKYAFVREALVAFNASHPEAGVAFTRAGSRELAAAIRDGQLDVTLLYELHAGSSRLTERLVHKERYVLAAHPSHRLAISGPAALVDLAGEQLVCVQRHDMANDYNPLLQQLRQHGLEPVVGQWADTPEEMMDLVMISGGICITPASSIFSIPAGQFVFRALPEFTMELDVRVAWASTPATPALAAFASHLEQSIDSHQDEIARKPPAWAMLDGLPQLRIAA